MSLICYNSYVIHGIKLAKTYWGLLMSLFSKLFKKVKEAIHISDTLALKKQTNDFSPLVLWWIKQKKDGYDMSSNRFPKWFYETYNIDFVFEVKNYLNNECLCHNKENRIILTEKGKHELDYYSCIVTIHKHPEYQLSVKDFTNNIKWHIVGDNDIIWGIFNNRQYEYIREKQWTKLKQNYLNMSSLLFDEKKYNEALKFISPAVFISTSGMLDDNKLSPYEIDSGFLDVTFLEISNYSMSSPIREIIKLENLTIDEVQQEFNTSLHIQSLKCILPFYYFDISSSWQMLKYAIQANIKKGIISTRDLKRQNIKLAYNLPNKNSKEYFYNSSENIIRAYKS